MVFVTEHARPGHPRHARHCGCHAAAGYPYGTSDRRVARPASLARAEVLVLCQRAEARWGGWDRSCRPCPRTYPRSERDQSRDPSLRPRYSSRPSAVLRSPRTPAAQRWISPLAYTSHLALTRAMQTGLSCSVPLHARVLRPIPRRDPSRVHLRTRTRGTWPSPRHDRLGSRIVNLSRLQVSLDVAARVLASSVEALDTPLGPPASRSVPGVCYSALRRLPRRDSHPLETNSVKRTMSCLLRHDAPCQYFISIRVAPATLHNCPDAERTERRPRSSLLFLNWFVPLFSAPDNCGRCRFAFA